MCKLIPWFKGLVAQVVNSLAAAILLVVVAPDKFSFQDLNELGRVAAAMALLAVANYILRSPLPVNGGNR